MLRFLLSLIIYSAAILTASSDMLRPFRHNQALSQQSIRAMITDKDGYLWIGTHDGLNRYDGKTIKTFTRVADDPHSLSSDNIFDFHIDSKGNLWVLTTFALNRYQPEFENFKRYPLKGSVLLANPFVDVEVDEAGRFWVAAENGLYLLEEEPPGLKRLDVQIPGRIRCLLPNGNHTFYIGTIEGLFEVDMNSLSVEEVDIGIEATVNTMVADGHDRLLLGTDEGVLVFDKDLNLLEHFRHERERMDTLSSNEVTNVFLDFEGRLWVGTTEGLNLQTTDGKGFTRFFHEPLNELSLTHGEITWIYQSQPGLIWIGTHRGLNVIDSISKKFETIRISGDLGPSEFQAIWDSHY